MWFFKKKNEKLSISKILETVPRCKTHHYEIKDDGKSVFINPCIQEAHNIGRFTHEDVLEWVNGTGPIVKGDTLSEKEQYSLLVDNLLDEKCGYHALRGKKWNSLLDYNVLNPAIDLSDIYHTSLSAIIKSIFSYHASIISSKFEHESDQEIQEEWLNVSYGIIGTLKAMGIGYYGASNTPEELENLIWIRDVTYDIAKYRHLVQQGYKFSDKNVN